MSFQFRQFSVSDSLCAMKVGTDSVLLGAWVHVSDVISVLDLGAGSGLLSLMVAQRNPQAVITAVEIDPEAAAECHKNFRDSSWSNHLFAVNADALAFCPPAPVDLVISNPPFFDEPLRSPDTSRALARHGSTLSPITVIDWASRHLSPTGSVALILPASQADDLIYHAEMLHLKERRRLDVATRSGRPPERTLLQFSRTDGPPLREFLTIRDAHNNYTPAYRHLTSSFYLHLTP